jgi:hypothetical protein
LPLQSWCAGRAPSMETAKTAFRSASTHFYARLTQAELNHWHSTQDGARERAEWINWSS